MDKRDAIEYLKDRLSEIPKLAKLPYNNDEYPLWRNTIAGILEELFGRDSSEYQYLLPCNWQLPTIKFEVMENYNQDNYCKNLKCIETAILSIINIHEIYGTEREPAAIKELPPKAFIAHEGETRALTMLKEFLEALGIQYFIAESKASNGRSIEKQVDWTQGKADFAICLATKGKATNKKTGKYYMAPNIADELGRARQVFGNKIILLVQKGVEIHTNIREIVYETFTTTNMEMTFIKIVKELMNWGFMKVGRPKE